MLIYDASQVGTNKSGLIYCIFPRSWLLTDSEWLGRWWFWVYIAICAAKESIERIYHHICAQAPSIEKFYQFLHDSDIYFSTSYKSIVLSHHIDDVIIFTKWNSCAFLRPVYTFRHLSIKMCQAAFPFKIRYRLWFLLVKIVPAEAFPSFLTDIFTLTWQMDSVV